MRTFDVSYIYRTYLGKWDLGLLFLGNVCLWTHAQKKVKFDDWYSAPAYISCIMHYFSLHIYSFSVTFFRLWFDTILKHCTTVYNASSYSLRMLYFYAFEQELLKDFNPCLNSTIYYFFSIFCKSYTPLLLYSFPKTYFVCIIHCGHHRGRHHKKKKLNVKKE